MSRYGKRLSLIVVTCLTWSPLLQAHEQVASDAWQVTMAPYGWAANIRGDLGHRKVGTHFVASSFSDIVKDVDVALMMMGEARRDSYSVLFDFMYINSSLTQNLPVGFPAAKLKAKGKVATGFVGAGYTVLSTDSVRLDAVAGLRGWHADVKLGLQGGPLNGVTGTTKRNWLDVTAGVRGLYTINDRFSITAWGLAGGGQAKKDWDLALLANWSINQNFTFTAGYRAMGVDYRRDGFVYDIVQKGPMIGLGYKF